MSDFLGNEELKLCINLFVTERYFAIQFSYSIHLVYAMYKVKFILGPNHYLSGEHIGPIGPLAEAYINVCKIVIKVTIPIFLF